MSQPIGALLKQIRESQGITLETIAHKTHISLPYLQAIEASDEDSLPSKVHLRGFLRLYAHELSVDLEELQVSADQPSPDFNDLPDQIAFEGEPSHPEHDEPQQEIIPGQKQPIEPTAESNHIEEFYLSPSTTSVPKASSETGKPSNSVQILKAIGTKIKQRRILLSLSIKDIHDTIHIPEAHLVAIELGQFDQLPSPVQARGMLINYANFLNMDTDALLLEFTDALQLQRIEKQAAPPKRGRRSARELSPTTLRLKNFFSLDLLILSTLFIAFAIFVIWGVNRILANGSSLTEGNEIPGVSDVLLASDTPTPMLSPEPDATELIDEQDAEPEDEEELPLFTPVVSTDPINIILLPRQRLWVQVSVDNEMVFQGRLLPGNAYDFSGQEQIDILTGNAGSLQILFNNQDIGSLGLIGRVANLSFTESGLVLPPSTSTPTITETPVTTPTPGEIDDQTD